MIPVAQANLEITANPLRNRILEHDLLRAFVAVVDYGGYTAAATVLYRTQAAVSQQIKRLEEAAQVQLLQHPRHEIRLTEQGKILLDYARRLIALNDEALSCVRSDVVTGKVRIGANNHFATTVLPPLLAKFCQIYPEVQIEMQTGLAIEMQKRLGQAYDLLINIHVAGQGSGHLLDRRPLRWITSKEHDVHNRDPLPIALMPPGSLSRELAIAALIEKNRVWHLVQESSNIVALQAAAEAGLAVTVSSIPPDNLRVLNHADGFPDLPDLDVTLETASRYLPRAAARLHEFLIDHIPVHT